MPAEARRRPPPSRRVRQRRPLRCRRILPLCFTGTDPEEPKTTGHLAFFNTELITTHHNSDSHHDISYIMIYIMIYHDMIHKYPNNVSDVILCHFGDVDFASFATYEYFMESQQQKSGGFCVFRGSRWRVASTFEGSQEAQEREKSSRVSSSGSADMLKSIEILWRFCS